VWQANHLDHAHQSARENEGSLLQVWQRSHAEIGAVIQRDNLQEELTLPLRALRRPPHSRPPPSVLRSVVRALAVLNARATGTPLLLPRPDNKESKLCALNGKNGGVLFSPLCKAMNSQKTSRLERVLPRAEELSPGLTGRLFESFYDSGAVLGSWLHLMFLRNPPNQSKFPGSLRHPQAV